jgi:hypothetical protein
VFLNRLSRFEGVAFLSLAHEIVTSDSVTTVGEVTRLAAIRRELGFSLDEAPDILRTDVAAERIDSASARTIVMIELVDLCHADRRLSVHESGVISRLTTMWMIDEKRLQGIENWVHRHRQLILEAHELIAKEA